MCAVSNINQNTYLEDNELSMWHYNTKVQLQGGQSGISSYRAGLLFAPVAGRDNLLPV